MKQEQQSLIKTLLIFADGAVDYADVSAMKFSPQYCQIFFKDGKMFLYKLFSKEPEEWSFCLFPITQFTEQFIFIADKSGIPLVKGV